MQTEECELAFSFTEPSPDDFLLAVQISKISPLEKQTLSRQLSILEKNGPSSLQTSNSLKLEYLLSYLETKLYGKPVERLTFTEILLRSSLISQTTR